MLKYLFLILFLFCSQFVYGDTIDGLTGEEFEITQWDGLPASPSVSPTNTARIFYNGTTDTLQISINGGAYFDISTSSTLTAYYLLDGSNTAGIFYLDTNKYLKKIDANTVGIYVNDILIQEWYAIAGAPPEGSYMGFGCLCY